MVGLNRKTNRIDKIIPRNKFFTLKQENPRFGPGQTHLNGKKGAQPSALKALLSFLPASQTTAGERRATITGALAAPIVR